MSDLNDLKSNSSALRIEENTTSRCHLTFREKKQPMTVGNFEVPLWVVSFIESRSLNEEEKVQTFMDDKDKILI